MANYTFNQPHFELHCTNLPEDALRIISFEGSEQISGLYEYRFRLLSEDPTLNTKDILNCNSTFIINRGEDEPQKISGIISNFKQLGRTPDYVSYQAVLVPKMWRLLLNQQSKVFQTVNIEKMVTQVLKDAGFSSSDYEFKLEKSYPDVEFAVQYQETDLNFIHRRLEHLGIFYFIDQRKDNDVIVFCDSNDNVLPIETSEDIYFNPNKDPFSVQETISELVHDESVVTGQIRLKDYNYEFPSKQLLVESQLNKNAPGSHFNYGDNFKDESEGEFLARVRNEEIVCKSSIYTGKGDCRLFRAGYKFQMGKHYRDDWNIEFLLTKVISRGTQRGLFGILPPTQKVEPTYENIFEAIPQSLAFRPARLALQPKIYGVMNAKVDAAGKGEHAEIDDQGRYKIILPFDLSGKKDGEASHYIRMIQPYAGPNFGVHFPLHKGTEVLLTFIDGDPDRPVISGAVPNPETISPVTNANQTKSVIRDHYGNEIIMDATPGDEHISLFSPHHDSGIQFGRSVRSWTQSNESEAVLGNKMGVVSGSRGEAVFGNSLDAKFGFLWNISAGLQFEGSWGGKYIHNNSYEIKSNKEPIIQTSRKDILSSSRQDHIIAAGDQVCIVGGSLSESSIFKSIEAPLVKKHAKEKTPVPAIAVNTLEKKKRNRSIVNIFPEKISLSVGDKKSTRNLDEYGRISGGELRQNLYEKTPKTARILSVFIPSLISSLVMGAVGETFWNSDAERDDLRWDRWITGPATLALTGVMSILAHFILKSEIKDSKIEPVLHNNPDASVSLGEKENVGKGIYLETRSGQNNQEISSNIQLHKNGRVEIVSNGQTYQTDSGAMEKGKKELVLRVGPKDNPSAKIVITDEQIVIDKGKTGIALTKDNKLFIVSESDVNLLAKGEINFSSNATVKKVGPHKIPRSKSVRLNGTTLEWKNRVKHPSFELK